MRIFDSVYNLASVFAVQGKTGEAKNLYRIVTENTEEVNPDLIGKSLHKLAQLETDPHEQVRMLKQCLAVLPTHNAAKKMLSGLRSKIKNG